MLSFRDLSYWEKRSFTENIDYVIIGSGIVGLSTAIELKQLHPESKIVILERGYLPTGASTKNAGFACFGSPSELLDDLKTSTPDKVKETILLRVQGLDRLLNRLGKTDIDYQNCGSYDLFTEQETDAFMYCSSQISFLNKLIEETTGLRDCYSVCEKGMIPGLPNIHGAIYNRHEGSIDTGKMMNLLLRKAVESGIVLLNRIRVTKILSQENNVQIATEFGSLCAKKVALCTNGLTQSLYPDIELEPARAQVLVTSPIHDLQLDSTYHYDKGYFYFRVVDKNRILIGGARNYDFAGERTEKIENTNLILDKIQELLREVIIPGQSFKIDYQWAGIMGIGKNKAPILKELEPNIYCAVRLGGMGVAMGSELGHRLANLLSFR